MQFRPPSEYFEGEKDKIMFSAKEKAQIAEIIEKTIRELNHPEMDNSNIQFQLHIQGKESWSYANIHENSKKPGPVNIFNEFAREILE